MDHQSSQDIISLLVLQRLPGTAASTLYKLFRTYHSLKGVLHASHAELSTVLSANALSTFEQFRSKGNQSPAGQRACRDLDYLQQQNISLLTFASEYYPQQLREIYSAPPLLMVAGNPQVLLREQIAVVGSRRASPSGLENARHFAAELAASGLVVTSGLALGIDAEAHRGALSVDADLNPTPTIAVVANGLDLCYPARHEKLRDEVRERGAIISEFPLGTPPQKENFPRRNRIISGLSKGVLIVEAEEKSGSLITARYALEQNRDVFAVPGSIHNPASRGCHQLIREGAKLIESVDDVLSELQHPFGQVAIKFSSSAEDETATVNEIKLTREEESLLDCLDENGVSMDQLTRRAGLPIETTLSLLLHLEIYGYVEPVGEGCYRRLMVNS